MADLAPWEEAATGKKSAPAAADAAPWEEAAGASAAPSGPPQIPGPTPGTVAPEKTPEPEGFMAGLGRAVGSVPEQLGRLKDAAAATGRGFWRQGAKTGAAVVQMLEEPVRPLTGSTTSMADRITRKATDLLGPETAGEAGGAMLMGGAAAKALPAAAATGTALQRVGQAAATGGALAMGSAPVGAPTSEDFAKNKAEQFGMGAALGGAGQAVAEAAPAVADAAKKMYFGTPGAEQQRLWQRAKNLGFSIRPDQARQDESRILQSGFGTSEQLQNQQVANKLASAPTGQEAQALTPKFFSERHQELGAKFDEIYKPGTQMKVDASAVQGLEDFLNYQQHVGYPWANRESQTAAGRIVAAYRQINPGQAKGIKLKVNAEDVQLLRNELSASARRAGDDFDRYSIGQVIDEIDQSIARNHPALAAKLTELRPQYRTLVTLERAATKGIVDPQGNVSAADLGRMLRATENKYVSGDSSHPLQELGQLGESFGIRGMGQARITSGKGLSSGGISDEVPVTKAGMMRSGIQAAKVAAEPLTHGTFEKHIREYSPNGRPQAESMATAQTRGALAGVAADAVSKVPMGEYKDRFWKEGEK